MILCIPSGRAVKLLHSFIKSFWRLFNSLNPLESEWFRLGVTISPRFNGGSNGS